MTDRKDHNWKEDDHNIDICKHCGMYRCVAEPQEKRNGRPRILDIEYSTPEGEIIAFNPTTVPECVA